MGSMPIPTVFDVVFAAGIALAAVALLGAANRFLSRRILAALVGVELAAALGAWLVFALRHAHERELAIAAGGLTGCALAVAGSVLLRGALLRGPGFDPHLAAAHAALRAHGRE